MAATRLVVPMALMVLAPLSRPSGRVKRATRRPWESVRTTEGLASTAAPFREMVTNSPGANPPPVMVTVSPG